jgi:hypothetical protein
MAAASEVLDGDELHPNAEHPAGRDHVPDREGSAPGGGRPRLVAELDDPANILLLASLDLGILLALQDISRLEVPDLADVLVAATALHHSVSLATRDCKFRVSGV